MKFFAIVAPLALLATGVFADPASLQASNLAVEKELNNLNAQLQACKPDSIISGGAMVSKAVTALSDAIQKADQEWASTTSLTESDAAPIMKTFRTCDMLVTKVVGRLIQLHPAFKQSLVIHYVDDKVGRISKTTNKFMADALAKVPAGDKQEGQKLQASVASHMKQLNDTYNGSEEQAEQAAINKLPQDKRPAAVFAKEDAQAQPAAQAQVPQGHAAAQKKRRQAL